MQNINGKFLYYAFVAGGNEVLQNQVELNRINVFPVSDKDTGTNLASTIRSIIDNIKPDKSYKETISKIADAALMGARGNSGIIFAQFLHGLNNETKDKQVITLKEFAESVKNSIPYMYDAIANPVEGTILTVINDWADYLISKKDSLSDFKNVVIDSLATLEKSLLDTKSKLKILNQHDFVDAGAKGFVVFLKGIIDFTIHRNIRKIALNSTENVSIVHSDNVNDGKIDYQYCTEAIIKKLIIGKDELQKILKQFGDSSVVAGSNSNCRFHVHTNEPAKLFFNLRNAGTITFQKVDDMIRQHEISTNRKWKVALVTDSTCDLSKELLDFYQVNVVPINLNFGENHYLDKISIQPEQFYNLIDNQDEFPKTSQINEQTFTNVYSHLASNYDAIISIHLSNKFSGTYQSSSKAAKRVQSEFGKPIYSIDSKNVSGGLGLLVLKAAQKIEAGNSVEEIVKSLSSSIGLSKIYVSVSNLQNMIKGGRVSKPKGFLANFLGLKPVISVDEEGKSQLFGKTLSQKSTYKKIFKHIEGLNKNNQVWNYIISHANNNDGVEIAVQKMFEITGKKPVSIVEISPVLGMHAGRGALAISVLLNDGDD